MFSTLVPAVTSSRFGIAQKGLELIALSRCCSVPLSNEKYPKMGYLCSRCTSREDAIPYCDAYLDIKVSLTSQKDALSDWTAQWLGIEPELVNVEVAL